MNKEEPMKTQKTDPNIQSDLIEANMTIEAPYGYVCDYNSTERIRLATLEELKRSIEAAPTGAIKIDGRTCYVELPFARILEIIQRNNHDS